VPTKTYHVTLRGPAARGSTISGAALHALLGVLLEACHGAVRLAFERRSSSTAAAASNWVERVVDFDLLGIEAGSTRLVVEARPLGSLMPAAIAQSMSVDVTAFDLFLAGLRDAMSAEADGERYDVPLLETYGKLAQILSFGFEEIDIGDPPCRLDAASLESMTKLRLRVPQPRQVRVSGRLEPVPHDGRAFTMRLGDGVVHGMASPSVTPEQLGALLGAHVVVSGMAVFRPSGAVLRLDAHHIEQADERASVWAQMPRPLFEAAEPAARYRVRQDPQSGLAAIMGKWPGDETDEEISVILERLS
jgi:hypothetical protein